MTDSQQSLSRGLQIGTVRQSLIDQIMAFEFDEPEISLPFTSRLAREQNWTHAFAFRVIHEYRRFIILAMVAGHPVTPSEQVDQAWHLHLVYTRSYWHELCRDILKTDLHHGPTQGGASEGEKFFDWYSETLKSYEKVFEQSPPDDVWPRPAKRFSDAGSGRWVDSANSLVLPFPKWLRPSTWIRESLRLFKYRDR